VRASAIIKKASGEKGHPCGTPHFMADGDDYARRERVEGRVKVGVGTKEMIFHTHNINLSIIFKKINYFFGVCVCVICGAMTCGVTVATAQRAD
jgi:hypothetical protein